MCAYTKCTCITNRKINRIKIIQEVRDFPTNCIYISLKESKISYVFKSLNSKIKLCELNSSSLNSLKLNLLFRKMGVIIKSLYQKQTTEIVHR